MSHITHPVGAEHALKLTPNNALIPGALTTIDQLYKLPSIAAAKFAAWRAVATTAAKLQIADSTGLVLPSYVEHFGAAQGSLWFNADVAQNTSYLLYAGAAFSRTNSGSIFAPFVFSYGFTETNAQFVCRKGTYQTEREEAAYGSSAIIDGLLVLGDENNAVINKGSKAFNGKTAVHWTGLFKVLEFGTYQIVFSRESSPVSLMVIITSPIPMLVVQVINNGSFGAVNLGAGAILEDTFFLLDIVYNGLGATNADKLKVYVNGIAKTVAFTGTIPAALNNGEEKLFIGDVNELSLIGSFDEVRAKTTLPQTNEVAWRSNQWSDPTYWTTTVQPIVFTVNDQHNGTILVTGSGFKPAGGADPTVTVNGVSRSISSVGDSSFVVTTPLQSTNELTVTNSDGNNETENFAAERRHAKSHSHGYDLTF
jgi:hypothetical protein